MGYTMRQHRGESATEAGDGGPVWHREKNHSFPRGSRDCGSCDSILSLSGRLNNLILRQSLIFSLLEGGKRRDNIHQEADYH